MTHEYILLEKIRKLVKSGRYRIRIHAIQHMIEEGFDEANIIEALTAGKSKIIEDYTDDCRCLILGKFHFTKNTASFLHIVCDYSMPDLVDIVTAYIPKKPWWLSPTKRGKV